MMRTKVPLLGGTVSIALMSTPGPRRSPTARVLAELQEKSKMSSSSKRPSDPVEGMQWHVKWQPEPGALGVKILSDDGLLADGEVVVVSFRPFHRALTKTH